jgi:hypothetical protein
LPLLKKKKKKSPPYYLALHVSPIIKKKS